MRHSPIVMLEKSNWNRLNRKNHKRYWYAGYVCPTCNEVKVMLRNVMSGRQYICRGDRQYIDPPLRRRRNTP